MDEVTNLINHQFRTLQYPMNHGDL